MLKMTGCGDSSVPKVFDTQWFHLKTLDPSVGEIENKDYLGLPAQLD